MLITTANAPVDEELMARLEGAVDFAASALTAQFGTSRTNVVGEHLGAVREGSISATHLFASLLPGYRGWRWAVVLAGSSDQEALTISEFSLVPGPDALVPLEWTPWERRVRHGDLGVGDLLPTGSGDARLVPAYAGSGDEELDELTSLLDSGRSRTLSGYGRAQAAQRWHDGLFGPAAPMAVVAPKRCEQCGFYIPLTGSLAASFGVCANEIAADGRVVDAEYGCGAHSDIVVEPESPIPAKAHVDAGLAELIEEVELV